MCCKTPSESGIIFCSGAPGYLDWTEIDTAHFLGNFPESVDLYATQYAGVSTGLYYWPALHLLMSHLISGGAPS